MNNKTKVKPGILIDRDTWLKFKEIYEHPSEVIQNVMKQMIEAPNETINSYYASNINTFQFLNPSEWNMSYSGNTITVSNYSNQESNSGTLMINSKFLEEKNKWQNKK